MNFKSLFEPFSVINRKTVLVLAGIEIVIALFIWQFASGGGGLIPTPGRVLNGMEEVLVRSSFMDDFFASLILTLKGMGISIVIALVIAYMSLIPVFIPIANFIVKCRYLTLTGLIFLFVLITSNGSQLKMSLLIFGIVPFFVTSLLSIISEINRQEYELCRTLRMNSWRTLWEVIIVGRIDTVFEVMRQNFAIAWMMITLVEGYSMSEGGLGTLIIKYNKVVNLPAVFAILIIIFVIGVLFDLLLGQLRKWLFPYTNLGTSK